MTQQPVAVVTGAGGLIGSYLIRTAARYAQTWRVCGLTRKDLELTDRAAVQQTWRALQPQLVIHCAALSRPQQCQTDPRLARIINVDVTARLAELARDIPLIYLSSDLVFDGREGGYEETAAVNPITVYAETKVSAERMVLANPQHTVVRTSLNGGVSPTGDRAFNEEMRLAWQDGRCLTLFTDEFRCPIPAVVTARAVWELAATHQSGLYHVAGTERLSRWQIGQLLAARWPHPKPRMEPGSIRDFSGLPRQPDVSLNCEKVQRLLSFPLPGFSAWLAAHPDEPF